MQSTGNSTGLKKMILGILMLLAIYYGAKFVSPYLASLGLDSILTGIVLRSVLSVACFIALGGMDWLRFDWKAIGHAWRFLGYITVFYVLFGILSFVLNSSQLTEAEIDAVTGADILRNTLYMVVLCIFIGINEEVMFRGLLLGGLLAGMNGRRRSALWAAIISSLVFGFFHVMSDMNPENPLSIAQGIMKTLQTGTMGLFFCVTVLEDHRLCGAMSTHGFTDWIVLMGKVLVGFDGAISYVNTDDRLAKASIVIYAVMCLIYLPKFIQAIRRLLKVEEPELGPFLTSPEKTERPTGAHFAR